MVKNRWFYWIAILVNTGCLVFNAWQNTIVSWLTIVFALNIAFLSILYSTASQQWRALGRFLATKNGLRNGYEAVKNYLDEATIFSQQVQAALSNINHIGQQEFAGLMSNIDNAIIREPLLATNEKIIALQKKGKEDNWVTQGVAAIAELKHDGMDVSEYCFSAINIIVKYLGANQGSFFLLKGEADDVYFELVACYAYDRKKYLEKKVNPGEGLLGQVYYEKSIICITDVPGDYIKITSGLGEATPGCICVVPLLSEGAIYGAIEIASFRKMEPSHLEYLRRIAESLGYNLSSLETHRRTEVLLRESQKMGEDMKSQETELRENMEKLTAAQEQMRRKQHEMDSLLASLSVIELDLDGNIIDANKIFSRTAGYDVAEIIGKHYNFLTQNDDTAQFQIMWDSIISGKIFSGEFKIVNRDKKEIWMAGNFTPILNEDGKPTKVIVITVFTTRDKEKLLELQEMVLAFKTCLPVAEINEDLSFKSANDLFLQELGIRRLELKQSSAKTVFKDISFGEVEKCLHDTDMRPNNTTLDIIRKNGSTSKFNSTLLRLSNNYNSHRKRGLVILRNSL
jgi:PAS domain S-box-containing protein